MGFSLALPSTLLLVTGTSYAFVSPPLYTQNIIKSNKLHSSLPSCQNHKLNYKSSHDCSIITHDDRQRTELLPAPRQQSHPSSRTSRASTSKLFSESSPSNDSISNVDEDEENLLWDNFATSIASTVTSSSSSSSSSSTYTEKGSFTVQLITLLRVGIPSIVAGLAATFTFPALALFLASIMNDAGVFAVLSQDSSQFVQNFLTVSGLLFSILIGQTYAFLYQQQEAVFYALFNEVTEAKSLLEQVALVCQGRAMYGRVLESISRYVSRDLKQLRADPAVLISARPVDDPLESIMYMTSVGVPSSVYETVKSLRQARAARLGALQRKLPKIHMVLLWILAVIELVSFPLLGAGTQTIGGYNILTVEGCLFGVMTFGIVMTMRVIGELYRPGGGAYNVDGVLGVMVKGLEEELKERLGGGKRYAAISKAPSAQYEISNASVDDGQIQRQLTIPSSSSSQLSSGNDLPIMQQGPKASDLFRPAKKVVSWVKNKRAMRNKDR